MFSLLAYVVKLHLSVTVGCRLGLDLSSCQHTKIYSSPNVKWLITMSFSCHIIQFFFFFNFSNFGFQSILIGYLILTRYKVKNLAVRNCAFTLRIYTELLLRISGLAHWGINDFSVSIISGSLMKQQGRSYQHPMRASKKCNLSAMHLLPF